MINQILGTIIEVLIIIILSEASIMFGKALYDDYFKSEMGITNIEINTNLEKEEYEKLYSELFGDEEQ